MCSNSRFARFFTHELDVREKLHTCIKQLLVRAAGLIQLDDLVAPTEMHSLLPSLSRVAMSARVVLPQLVPPCEDDILEVAVASKTEELSKMACLRASSIVYGYLSQRRAGSNFGTVQVVLEGIIQVVA